MDNKMREAFETDTAEWSSNYDKRDADGSYSDKSVDCAWKTWQRTWQAALYQEQEAEPTLVVTNTGVVFHKNNVDADFFAKAVEIGTPYYTRPQPATIPEGWKVVPLTPTKTMREAFHSAHEVWEDGGTDGIGSPDYQWHAMLSSAPSPAEEEWISCEERLPPVSADRDPAHVWWFDADSGMVILDYWYSCKEERTHWKPTGLTRPQPPKGEE